jgi:hypothetical protein
MYDVSTAKFALRVLRNPKVELSTPLQAQDLLDKKADFVILRKDMRAWYVGDEKQGDGFWYSWIGFSKKHPTGYTEKNWKKDNITKEDSEKIVSSWKMDLGGLKTIPLAHVFFDTEAELQEWFGESLWADLVMKLII